MGAQVTWPVSAMVVSATGAPVAGQVVSWSAGSTGVTVTSAQSATGADGVASSQGSVGPFSTSVAATVNACVAGTQTCVRFKVIPVQASTEGLIAGSGMQQYVAAGQGLAPMAVRVIDAFGNPVVGAPVVFEEAFFGWTQPCAAQGSCPAAPLLAQAAVQAISGLDGTATLTPVATNGMPGRLLVTAVAGTNAMLNVELDAPP